jgi:hypothetical protein
VEEEASFIITLDETKTPVHNSVNRSSTHTFFSV